MKSKEILPESERIADPESDYIPPTMKLYHRALLAAEARVEELEREVEDIRETGLDQIGPD